MTEQLIGDRYQVIQLLSSGTAVTTYRAIDLNHPEQRQCVVKQFQPDRCPTDQLTAYCQLFAEEAASLQGLGDHDSIPELLDYFEYQDDLYLVQEHIDGHPLTAEVILGQRWSSEAVLAFVEEMLTLLVRVHDYGMIHRDLKPSNITRRRHDGRLVLIDFGAVTPLDVTEHARGINPLIVGTPGYMPPEQLAGNPQPNSDVYALGMIAIQMLTGLLLRQLRQDENSEWVWREQAGVSESVATVLAQMIHPDHTQRFTSAEAALTAIQSLQQESEVPEEIQAIAQAASHAQFYPLAEQAFAPTLTTQTTEAMPHPPVDRMAYGPKPLVQVAPLARQPQVKDCRPNWAIAGAAAIMLAANTPGIAEQFQPLPQPVAATLTMSTQACPKVTSPPVQTDFCHDLRPDQAVTLIL